MWLPVVAVVALHVACFAYLLWHNPSVDNNYTMDDGYIYAGYIRNAVHGHWFEYNPGEKSGGITGLLWYLVQVPLVFLLRIRLGEVPALHITTYLVSIVCSVSYVALAYVLARELTGSPILGFAAAAMIAGDFQLLWGDLSGLEIPLTTLSVTFSLLCALRATNPEIAPERRARYLQTLCVLSTLAYSIRPDLIAWYVGVAVYLAVAAPITSRRSGMTVAACCLAGSLCVCAIYRWQTARWLPGSFYGKVAHSPGHLKVFSQFAELIRGMSVAEMAGYALVVIIMCLQPGSSHLKKCYLLPIIASSFFFSFKVLTFPITGQEHRYISPLTPVYIIFGYGMLLKPVLTRMTGRLLNAPASSLRHNIAGGLMAVLWALISVAGVLHKRHVYQDWIEDRLHGDIAVAQWLKRNTLPQARIASEPIGTIHFYSNRYTIDVVGLTSPRFAGMYPDWKRLLPAIHHAGASYLVYYPEWFRTLGHYAGVPPGLASAQSFDIPGNTVGIGSTPIVIYRVLPGDP